MIELNRITDIDRLMSWRKEVIANVFGVVADDALMSANRKYYERHIEDGTHIAWVISRDEEELGCGSVCISDELPSPDNPTGQCAYIMNIYVRTPYRNQGIAHHIVRALVKESLDLGCDKIYLESTDMAKPLYAGIGFRDMENMMRYEN